MAFFFDYGIPWLALPTAKRIVDTFSVSGYNRNTENGCLSACFPVTTTHTTDVSGTHGHNGQKRPQDHSHSSQKRRKRLKINTNQSFCLVRKREENPFRFIDNAETRVCRWVCRENSLLHFVKRGGILVQNKVGSCFIRGLIAPHRCDSSGVEFGRILSRYFYYRRSVPCCNFKKTTR